MTAKPRPKHSYTREDVKKALEDVENGIPVSVAAQKYDIPKSTLHDKVNHKTPVETTFGPDPVLTSEEGDRILGWIFYCSDGGFPFTKSQLCNAVKSYVILTGRENPFTDDHPGRHWYEGFCRRHPELAIRIAQHMSTSRAGISEQQLRAWFKAVYVELEKKNLIHIDPSRVFNLDESAFYLVPNTKKVLARRGSKCVHKVSAGDDKENLTVLFNVNAAGLMVPPLILYWYERLPRSVVANLPKGWMAGNTDRGWMTADSFYNYIVKTFHPWLVKQKIELPIVLYMDGHKSHVSMALVKFCMENGIELVSLYPNSTHILQPLDVAVFHPMKVSWLKAVEKYRYENHEVRLSKENFATVLQATIADMDLTTTIKNGFRTCGLFPFSPDAVNYAKLKTFRKDESDDERTKKPTEEPPPASQHGKKGEVKKLLELFVKNLEPGVIDDFLFAEQNHGLLKDSQNQKLYAMWIKMKKECGTYFNCLLNLIFFITY